MNIPINGHIMKEKALDFMKQLDIEMYHASDCWLHAWKARYSIFFREVSCESNSVTPEIIESWKGTSLPTILSRFQVKEMYNANEFALFYQGLPNKTLHRKREKCFGGKHRKV